MLLIGFSLGFGLTGNLIMALCSLQLAQSKWIIILLVISTLCGLPFYKQIGEDIRTIILETLHVFKISNRYASLLLLVLVIGYGARGLLPPTGFDALMYHLSTVKLYLQQGGFWDIYFNAQSDYPMLTEMNFMIGLVLNNDIICKTLSFLLGLMTLASIACLCKLYFDNTKIIIPSMLVFCTFTCVIANMSNCDVDIPQALWTVLALIILELYIRNKNTYYLIVVAVLAGMAVQTKIFGVFVLPLLLMRLLIHKKNLIFTFDGIRESLILTTIPLIMGLPWYIKSYVYNGTILSISHSSIAGQGLDNPMGIKCSSDFFYWLVNIFLRIFTSPWTFSIFPSQHQGDTVGPLFIAILPFLFFISIPNRVKALLLVLGTFFMQILVMEIWFIQGGSSIRYSMVLLTIGAPLICWTVEQLSTYPQIRKILLFIIICIVSLGALLFMKRYNKEWLALLKLQSRDQYYSNVLPEYAVISTINKLSGDKVVMPLYNYSDYLLNVPYITLYKRYNTLKEMKKDFRDKNIGYIFANDKLDIANNRNTFPNFTEKVCIDSTHGFRLFKLAQSY